MTSAEEKPVRFLGFSGTLMIFSDSRLLIENQGERDSMTPAEEQQYVRGRWNDVSRAIMIYCCVDGMPIAWHSFSSWHEAYLFTLEREDKIKNIKEEVRYAKIDVEAISGFESEGNKRMEAAYRRILAREQAALAELKKGWRG